MYQARTDAPDRRRTVRRGTAQYDEDDHEPEEDEKDDEEDEDDDEDDHDENDDDDDGDASISDETVTKTVIKWFWAGDSANGVQDNWVEYDAAASAKYEAARQAGEDKVQVDDQRFIDLTDMVQRRYDDKNRRRTVKRTETKKRAAASRSDEPPGRKKRKVGNNDSGGGTSAASAAASDASSAAAAAAAAPAAPTVGHLALPNVPDDWDGFDSLDYFECNVDKGSAEFEWISQVMRRTTEAAHTMNDFNHKIKFRRLEIVSVKRVQNPSTWMAYNSFREQIISESSGRTPAVANGDLNSVATDLKGAAAVKSEAAANEFFLFHGLNANLHADKITKFGMDPRYSSVEGMFGAGLYFADLASKSNQYVHCGKCRLTGAMPRDPVARAKFVKECKCKQSDEACALLCRVSLGDTLIEKNFRGNNPGQFWHARRREPEKPGGGGIYNSVVGEGRTKGGSSLEFREYIVYESKQVYPEYKVYYKRVV